MDRYYSFLYQNFKIEYIGLFMEIDKAIELAEDKILLYNNGNGAMIICRHGKGEHPSYCWSRNLKGADLNDAHTQAMKQVQKLSRSKKDDFWIDKNHFSRFEIMEIEA